MQKVKVRWCGKLIAGWFVSWSNEDTAVIKLSRRRGLREFHESKIVWAI